MTHSKNLDIRTSLVSQLCGHALALLMKVWSYTLRYELNGKIGLHMPDLAAPPVLFALWHNRIFTMPAVWARTGGKHRKTVILTSASKDGTTLAVALDYFGLGAIRGSSSRRAVMALIGMKKALNEGFDVCITPDGPKGPRYQVQPGVMKIAQTTGAPIIPIHIRYGSAWCFRSWDRFVLPKPFSKVSIHFDEPIHIAKNLSEDDFEKSRLQLEDCLIQGVDDK